MAEDMKFPQIVLKKGVAMTRIGPQGLIQVSSETMTIIAVAGVVFMAAGYSCIVTSLLDSKHKVGSKHYMGNAVDLRTRHVLARDGQLMVEKIAGTLAHALGADYDIVLESDHIHAEYDPKGQSNGRRAI